MNRIYQGRVSSVQVPKFGAKNEWEPLDLDPKLAKQKGEDALWEHHKLFQDAVNYYIVALASLGVSPESKLTKLRELLDKVWVAADKKGQLRRGMRESLQRAWQLDQPPTLIEAVERFTQPLIEDSIPLTTAEKAAEFLLFNLGGESAIQQGGPVFLPMFCDVDSTPTYWLSPERRGRADAEERLQRALHSELDLSQIRALAGTISLGSVVNLQPSTSPDVGEAVIERLKQAAATFADKIETVVLEEWLKSLPADFTLPKRRGGNINIRRVDACILFLAFPNDVTKRLFQSTFSPPKPRRVAPSKSPNEASEVDDSRFVVDGDDPIKLSRGTRGWVFRGFTALPIWDGDGRTLAWKEFDIAAFKEALKVYNQFQQNVQKREEKLDSLATKLLVMDGLRALDGYAGDNEVDRKLSARLKRVWDKSEANRRFRLEMTVKRSRSRSSSVTHGLIAFDSSSMMTSPRSTGSPTDALRPMACAGVL